MSQYMSVVLKDVKANRYLTLASYSRSHPFQQFILNDAPFSVSYMEAVQMTIPMIEESISVLNRLISKNKEMIVSYEADMRWIGAANNALNDKLEAINDIKNSIDFCNEEINDYREIISYLNFMYNMIDYNKTIELYIGIEIGTSDGKLIDKTVDDTDVECD